MGHKAQLPSVEAACCCRALCIMLNIPVVASVCGHSCSSAELLHKVFQGCLYLFFFFTLEFSTFPLWVGTIWHNYYQDLRAIPTQAVHRRRAAHRGRKWRKEGGMEWGEKVGEITSKEYSGLVSWDRQLFICPPWAPLPSTTACSPCVVQDTGMAT